MEPLNVKKNAPRPSVCIAKFTFRDGTAGRTSLSQLFEHIPMEFPRLLAKREIIANAVVRNFSSETFCKGTQISLILRYDCGKNFKKCALFRGIIAKHVVEAD